MYHWYKVGIRVGNYTDCCPRLLIAQAVRLVTDLLIQTG